MAIMDYSQFTNTTGRLDAAGRQRLLRALGRAAEPVNEPETAAERYRRNLKLDAWHALWEHYGLITGVSQSLSKAATVLQQACVMHLKARGRWAVDPIHTVEKMLERDGMALLMEELGI